MKKQLLLLALMLSIATNTFAILLRTSASDLWYYLNTETKIAKVHKYMNDDKYSGDIVIPETVRYDGENYRVTSIEDDAFYYCRNLTSITIPSSVISIGRSAFDYCSGLTSVHISDIAAWCKISFRDWYSNPLSYARHLYLEEEEIKGLVIPSSVTSINDYTFYGCSSLTSVTVPNSVTSIGYDAFRDCSGLNSVHISDLEAWCKMSFHYDSKKYYPSNPLSYADHLFLNEEEIKDLVIPNSVTYIGNCVFYGCKALTSVTISSSVTNIGVLAFSGCRGLTSVTIPSSVTSIENNAFEYCIGLTSVTIPSSVTSMGSAVFAGCDNLTSVTIIANMMSIEAYTFADCSSLSFVTISDSVKSIGKGAFQGCSSLTSITIPDSLSTIENDAFWGCSSLTSVKIPGSVTSIGEYAFRGCSGLTSVTIPSSVTSIGYDAFYNCRGLTAVHISDLEAWCKIDFMQFYSNPLYYAHHLYLNGEDIKDLVIPYGVTRIGNYAFEHCDCLTSVTIPNSVTSIGVQSFLDCSGLNSVTVPSSVTRIGNAAFSFCSSLTSAIIGSGVETIGSGAFDYCPELIDVYCYTEKVPCIKDYNNEPCTSAFYSSHIEKATLHVPSASIDAYKAVEPWKSFKSIISLNDNSEPDIPTPRDSLITLDFDDDYATLFPMINGVSSNVTTDGDITETITSSPVDGVTVTVSKADEGKTPNRIFANSPRLRMYSGTFTVKGTNITKIVFDASQLNLTTTIGTLNDSVWTGNPTSTVVFSVENKTFLRRIVVNKQLKKDRIKGDVNGDLTVDVADIATVIDVMASSRNDASADVNHDGTVDVADIATIIDIMAGVGSDPVSARMAEAEATDAE